MRRKISKKRTTDQVFETRRAAFRAAKRDHGVPMGKQPDEVVEPFTKRGKELELDGRNKRLYIFRFILRYFGIGKSREDIHIREDKEVFYKDGKQEKHFNAGEKSKKLRTHYYKRR